MTYANTKANAYQQTNAQSAEYADPYNVIRMLMETCLTRMAGARGAIERKDYETKSSQCGKAIAILHALRDTLDRERGGEVAANLDSLYLYMVEQVMAASVELNVDKLDHVAQLLREIKSGWDGIREESATLQAGAVVADGGFSVRG